MQTLAARAAGNGCLSARREAVEVAAAMAMAAGPIEAALASQGFTRGLEVGGMDVIQVRGDDDARAGAITGTSSDVRGVGTFCFPPSNVAESANSNGFPLSNIVVLGLAMSDDEGWVLRVYAPSSGSMIS